MYTSKLLASIALEIDFALLYNKILCSQYFLNQATIVNLLNVKRDFHFTPRRQSQLFAWGWVVYSLQ